MKNEGLVQREIQRYVESLGGVVLKTQGIKVGTPDLIGSIRVNDTVYPFAVEVKVPGKEHTLTKIQKWRIQQWQNHGWVSFVAISPEDFKFQFEQFTGIKLDGKN